MHGSGSECCMVFESYVVIWIYDRVTSIWLLLSDSFGLGVTQKPHWAGKSDSVMCVSGCVTKIWMYLLVVSSVMYICGHQKQAQPTCTIVVMLESKAIQS